MYYAANTHLPSQFLVSENDMHPPRLWEQTAKSKGEATDQGPYSGLEDESRLDLLKKLIFTPGGFRFISTQPYLIIREMYGPEWATDLSTFVFVYIYFYSGVAWLYLFINLFGLQFKSFLCTRPHSLTTQSQDSLLTISLSIPINIMERYVSAQPAAIIRLIRGDDSFINLEGQRARVK